MMNELFELVVVGNGPSALTFLRNYKKNRKEKIAHIDSFIFSKSQSRIKVKQDHTKIWKIIENNNQTSKINITNFYEYSLFSKGGLSSKWGGGLSIPDQVDLPFDRKTNSEIIDACHKVIDDIGFFSYKNNPLCDYLNIKKSSQPIHSSISLQFKNSFSTTYGFAVKAIKTKGNNNCKLCGLCNINCFNNSFFSADMLNYSSNVDKVYFSSILKSFTKKNGVFVLEIESLVDKSITLIHSKKLIMASGTLNTIRILSKYFSPKEPNLFRFPLKHNLLIRTVFLSLKKNDNIKSPSGIILGKTFINKSENIYTSLTSGSSIALSDLLTFIPTYLTRFLLLIKNNIFVGMSFFSSNFIKTSIILKKGSDISFESKIKSKKLIFFSVIKFILSMILNLNIPIYIKILKSGSDLHYSGTFNIDNKKHNHLNFNCEFNSIKNLYIIDGTWLNHVSEKPHSLTLMGNALRIAHKLSSS